MQLENTSWEICTFWVRVEWSMYRILFVGQLKFYANWLFAIIATSLPCYVRPWLLYNGIVKWFQYHRNISIGGVASKRANCVDNRFRATEEVARSVDALVSYSIYLYPARVTHLSMANQFGRIWWIVFIRGGQKQSSLTHSHSTISPNEPSKYNWPRTALRLTIKMSHYY